MSRPYAADDSETISARLRELRAEREAAQAGCDCPDGIGERGEPVKLHEAGCPHHQPPPAPPPACLMLIELHGLRIDRDRPRVVPARVLP
jgi:hypothetical protein